MVTEWQYHKLTETDTETFFTILNFPKPKPRLFSETNFFRNRNRDFFSETKFSETETETLKDLAKVSKPRSFETEMSISVEEVAAFSEFVKICICNLLGRLQKEMYPGYTNTQG